MNYRTSMLMSLGLLIASLACHAAPPEGKGGGGGQALDILEVFADEATGHLTLIGSEFIDPIVTLGDTPDALVEVSNSGTELVVELPAGLIPGDYLTQLSP